MKKYLLVTTLLAATTGAAHADVSVSGDARMGISSWDSDAKNFFDAGGNSTLGFSSRARVRFSLSSETDSGIKLGAQFRAGDASKAASGGAPADADMKGTVFIDVPEFGKLTMGDAEGAAQAAVVQFSPIGYDELAKLQEFTFLTGGDTSKGNDVLYTYTKDALAVSLSMGNPGAPEGDSSTETSDDAAVGVAYTTEFWKVAAGFEDNGERSQSIISGSFGNGQAEVKAAYGVTNDDLSQYVIAGSYIIGHTTLNAFYREDEIRKKNAAGVEVTPQTAYGVGATYDLGSGLAVLAGYSHEKTLGKGLYSLGLTMAF